MFLRRVLVMLLSYMRLEPWEPPRRTFFLVRGNFRPTQEESDGALPICGLSGHSISRLDPEALRLER